MSIDERELRSRLAETAALAGPPRFTTEDLAARVRRIRRRRRGRAGTIAAVSVAAVASAVAVPAALSGSSQPAIRRPAISSPAPPTPELSYTVTANGQTRAVSARGGALPLFTITPGKRLTMTAEVTVPAHVTVTGVWLGITNGILSPGPNGPPNMSPILAAQPRTRIGPGAHQFRLHWTVPAGLRPGTSRQLSVQWGWHNGLGERFVADFAVPLPSGAASPAAVARRLRTMALHAVAICDGARPAWILAVRTTFSKAMAMMGGGGGIADNATDAVYLVLMKGDFTLYNGGPVPSCAEWKAPAPTGHYFSAIFDAATFVTLEAGVGNRPPPVPLQTLGPVLNLT